MQRFYEQGELAGLPRFGRTKPCYSAIYLMVDNGSSMPIAYTIGIGFWMMGGTVSSKARDRDESVGWRWPLDGMVPDAAIGT